MARVDDDVVMAEIRTLRAEVAELRARQRQRSQIPKWACTCALALSPSLGHALDVPTDDIAGGLPIDAGMMVSRFDAIAQAITALEDGRPGQRELGPAVENWSSSAGSPDVAEAVVDGLELQLETTGRSVRIELESVGEEAGFISGEGGSDNFFFVRLERRTENVDIDWVHVEEFQFRTQATGASGTALRLPPSVIDAVDEPGAGSTQYRVLAWTSASGAAPVVRVVTVRLVAQEAASSGG